MALPPACSVAWDNFSLSEGQFPTCKPVGGEFPPASFQLFKSTKAQGSAEI